MTTAESSLPAGVQRTVDIANRDAHRAGMKNAPDPDAPVVPEGAASANAMQAGLQAPEGKPKPAGPPANVTPMPESHEEKTWRGRYQKEVPQLKGEIEVLRTQILQLQAAVSQTQAPKPAAEGKPGDQAPAGKASPWYTPEQVEDFGQDFFDLVDRRVGMAESQAEEKYGAAMKKLQQENSQLQARLGELGQGVQRVQQAPLFTLLDQKLPDWKQLNSDPDFLEWAKATPVSDLDDKPMLAALRDNFRAGRVESVVKIFQAYKQNRQGARETGQQAAPRQPDVPLGSQPPAANVAPSNPQHARPGTTLEHLAGPGTPHEAQSELPPQQKFRVWTDVSIAKFYDAVRRGDIDQRDANVLEIDLQQAISPQGRAQGRYRPQ